MTHPTELLAPYVDGSLPEAERDRVEAHLATCDRCSEEVGLARAVLPALDAIEEEPVPLGVTAPVLERVGGETGRRWSAGPGTDHGSGRWGKLPLVLGGAAAASIAIVLAITLSGGPTGQPTAGGGTAAGATGAAPRKDLSMQGVRLERQARNYDDASLRELADSVATPALGAAEAQPAPATSPAFAAPDPAVACLERAGATFSARDRPVRLIQARFRGTPAYLGVFAEGAAGRPPDRVAIWVVAISDCRVLTLVSEPR